ncbi:MAG: alpha-keto acid decarboxylase family protein [Candidatus Methylomirabilales bacterium]
MKIGEYLFRQVRAKGVDHTFGIPGDFAIPLWRVQEAEGLQPVVVTHEPSAGFAADAYARLRGLGVAMVTFGAGGLNMVNPIGQAYAERSPVLVISGAPEISGRDRDALVHHRVKTFESQLNVYREVTAEAVALNDPDTALGEVDRVLDTILQLKRPGYVEVPRDMVEVAGRPSAKRAEAKHPGGAALEEAMGEVIGRLNGSHRPVIYGGVEIERFDLREKLIALVEKLNLPIVTSLEGKTVFPENHPHFVGLYMGQVGSEVAREAIEKADCVLMLGAFLTDVNTGLFTAKIDRAKLISASSEEVVVSYHRYPDVNLVDLIDYLLASEEVRSHPLSPAPEDGRPKGRLGDRLEPVTIIEEINRFLKPGRYIVLSDVGDCLYASVDLRTDHFLGPGYYNSMGFGVPAAIAAGLAVPERRAIALVGDGGFYMTGMELGTARRLGLNPIVILWNNGCYGTLKAIAGPESYFELPSCDYVGIIRSMGGDGVRVTTRKQFRQALEQALESKTFFLIDAVLPGDQMSQTWQRIAAEVRSRLRP